jgi:hypothetical protein
MQTTNTNSSVGSSSRRRIWTAARRVATHLLPLVPLLAAPQPTLASCPADIAGPGGASDGLVNALDYLQLIAEWGSPCNGTCSADITGPVGIPDGNVDSLDFLELIEQWGACPVNTCDFTDIREGIPGVENDPPNIQRHYDAINRTAWLFRDVPFSVYFNAPFELMLPPVLDRLHTLEGCTGLPTDVAGIQAALENAAAVIHVPLGLVFSTPRALMPEENAAIDQLRLLDIGFPPAPGTDEEAANEAWSIDQVVNGAGDLTYLDFRNADDDNTTPAQRAALQGGLAGGGLEFSIWEDFIRNNYRCCCTAIDAQGHTLGFECCHDTSDPKWCRRSPSQFCRVAADWGCVFGNQCVVGTGTSCDDPD